MSTVEPTIEPTAESLAPTESAAKSTAAQDGHRERYDVEIIASGNQTIQDENDTIEYDFASTVTSISLNKVRNGTVGFETTVTYGRLTLPEDEYFAGHFIMTKLEARVSRFDRKRTNFSGVDVYTFWNRKTRHLVLLPARLCGTRTVREHVLPQSAIVKLRSDRLERLF